MKYILSLLLIITSLSSIEQIDVDNHFKNCNQILNNGYFKTCYDYQYKSATASYIELTNISNEIGIKERFSFYDDKSIPVQFRTSSSDYTNKGKDRGHIQSDASNDYSKEALYSTYSMSNITMQYPLTNRRSYLAVEKRERILVSKYNNIRALTIIKYTDESVNGIRIPLDYTKIFWNDNIKECYIIKNDNIVYSLEQMKTNCSSIK